MEMKYSMEWFIKYLKINMVGNSKQGFTDHNASGRWRQAQQTQRLLSPDRTVFSCFLSCELQCFCTYSSRLLVFKRTYSREFLLYVGRTTFLELNSAHAKELRDLGLLRRPTPSLTASRPQRRRYKRCEEAERGVSAEVSELG